MINIKKMMSNSFIYLILIFVSLLLMMPFVWLVSTSFKGPSENIFYPIKFIPEGFYYENYVIAWTQNGFAQFTWNNILLTALGVSAALVFSLTAGYALARFRFPGRQVVFNAILLTMIIPFQVIMISLYEVAFFFNLGNSYLGVILPFAVNAFYIFFIRQSFISIPGEIEEAARMDGCGEFRLWAAIMLPLITPFAATLAIFSFVTQWNDFLWPLLILKDYDKFTLPLGMAYMMSNFGQSWRVVAAGAVIVIIPIVIFYIFMQRYLLKGMVAGAVKG